MSLRNLSIRKFRTEDAKAVAKIINSSHEEVTPKFVLTLSNRRKMYVATNEDGKIVGTAAMEHDTIYTIFADAQYQNQGVEAALVSLLEEIAANNGFGVIKLEASINEQKLYERLGYSVIGEAEANELGNNVLLERYLG